MIERLTLVPSSCIALKFGARIGSSCFVYETSAPSKPALCAATARSPSRLTSIAIAVLSLLAFLLGGCQSAPKDPLPSWNEGANKTTVLEFVSRVTDPDSPDYVPPEDRLAVFDNDGTLVVERPWTVQGSFAFSRACQMLAADETLATREEWAEVAQRLTEMPEHPGYGFVFKLLSLTHTGMGADVFRQQVTEFFASDGRHALGIPWPAVAYQPMVELVTYLQSLGFETWVVSAGEGWFVQSIAEDLYDIPRSQVIGSEMNTELVQGTVVRREGFQRINSGDNKAINLRIRAGRRPVLAVGNGDNDVALLSQATSGQGPSLALVIHHDDADREFAYERGSEKLLAAATDNGWQRVSMKQDFLRVFAPDPGPLPGPPGCGRINPGPTF